MSLHNIILGKITKKFGNKKVRRNCTSRSVPLQSGDGHVDFDSGPEFEPHRHQIVTRQFGERHAIDLLKDEIFGVLFAPGNCTNEVGNLIAT